MKVTQELLTQLRAECLQAAQDIKDFGYTDCNADPNEVLSLITEVELLRKRNQILSNMLDEARAEGERLRAVRAWQPIETAPRDGRGEVLLLVGPELYANCRYGWFSQRDKVWHCFERFSEDPVVDAYRENEVRGWMPLPNPPRSWRQTP